MRLYLVDGICVDVPHIDASKNKCIEELTGQIVDKYVLNFDQNKELANRIMGVRGFQCMWWHDGLSETSFGIWPSSVEF